MAKGFRGGMGMGGNMSQVMAQAQRMQRQIEMAQAENSYRQASVRER